ncbi:uncharacterized protein [Lolium perenne]|uniref:uncharacterized protein n=1 Tax=Lolium perenne TaxID=4522 RepID=UPI003A996116
MALIPHGGAGGSTVSFPCPVLTPTNYTVWAIKVEANLDAQGLWEAVVPAEDAAEAIIAKKDKTARAYLLGALSEDILLQVSSKKTAAEVWASLKARFVGADRVRAARLSTLRGNFDRLIMADGEELDVYAGKISGMAAKYANLGATLSDAEMVKKILDTVPDDLFTAVAGIEQFCDVETVCFDEVLGRLKSFQERSERRKVALGGERRQDQLLLTAAQWEAQRRARVGGHDDDVGNGADLGKRGKCYYCGIRGHFERDCRKKKKEKQAEALLVDDQPGLY